MLDISSCAHGWVRPRPAPTDQVSAAWAGRGRNHSRRAALHLWLYTHTRRGPPFLQAKLHPRLRPRPFSSYSLTPAACTLHSRHGRCAASQPHISFKCFNKLIQLKINFQLQQASITALTSPSNCSCSMLGISLCAHGWERPRPAPTDSVLHAQCHAANKATHLFPTNQL